MIKREEVKIELNGKTSEHVLYSIENVKKLVVLFPGGNSNTTRPFFYYLRDYFLRNDYDVLTISYKNIVDRGDEFEVQIKKIIESIYQAMKFNSEIKTYDEYIFISRSIGNVIANRTKMDYKIDVSKSIYVAPTAEGLITIKQFPGLIITATNDEYLEKDSIKEMLTYKDHEVIIFEDGDHSLESDNTLETIDFHRKIVEKVISFVNEK